MEVKIDARPLDTALSPAPVPAAWIANDRLPVGATVLTGLAGLPCDHRTLAAVAASLVADVAGKGEVFGASASGAGVLYLVLGAKGAARTARALAAAVPGTVSEDVLFAAPAAKLGPSLARALEAELSEPDAPSLVIIDGAHAGLEGRTTLAQAVSALSRVASVHRAAVVILVPLTLKNRMDVKSPATGVMPAADAVWEIYDAQPSRARCVCTHRAGASGFDVPLAAPSRGTPPAARARCQPKSD